MMNTMKKLGALLLALVMVLSLGVTAFAEAETEPAEEEDLSALARIGEETETSRAVKVTNLTGTDIMGLNIRKSGEWEFSAELLAEGDNFEKEEVSLFCYEPETAEEATATDAEAEAEEAEPVLYDIQIVWTDWTVGVLYNVELDDMDEAELQRSWNSLPYIVYKSLASGEEVNTEEAETAAYLADPANSQSSGGSSSGSGSSSGGSSSGGGSYGGDSGCIDNGLLW